MLYLDREASVTLFEAILDLYDVELIGHIELCHYLNNLLELIDRKTIFAKEIKRIIYCHGGEPYEYFSNEREEEGDVFTQLEVTLVGRDSGMMGADADYKQGLFEENSLLLNFMTSVSGMSDWIFHAYDADHFPSVPHGHSVEDKRVKLNPYTGVVYDKHSKENTLKRLSRSMRIALWNDKEFREFALRAINWYMDTYPRYDFGIRNPRRLPRFR